MGGDTKKCTEGDRGGCEDVRKSRKDTQEKGHEALASHPFVIVTLNLIVGNKGPQWTIFPLFFHNLASEDACICLKREDVQSRIPFVGIDVLTILNAFPFGTIDFSTCEIMDRE